MELATVTCEGRGATDRLLEDVVARLSGDGVRILGALRASGQGGASPHCDSDLWLLPDGPAVRITQNLGAGSAACRMDAGALEEAVGIATQRLGAHGADLVVLNKFGLREAEGHGFRALIAEALAHRVPVLIGLSDTHRAAFERFAGGLATTLLPDGESVVTWCRTVLGALKPGLPPGRGGLT